MELLIKVNEFLPALARVQLAISSRSFVRTAVAHDFLKLERKRKFDFLPTKQCRQLASQFQPGRRGGVRYCNAVSAVAFHTLKDLIQHDIGIRSGGLWSRQMEAAFYEWFVNGLQFAGEVRHDDKRAYKVEIVIPDMNQPESSRIVMRLPRLT